ncbi:N-alpha-acetyltransferase 40 [Daktulosphaira vitifoliae]|uniref:N-alpha-acetyltransferase 40 n=1 Tax=Daktulosphaira vitifoliae TaxID=58002 RepID=UPI0021AA664C|nr:N-alpha-acetyltransferase 40 [Daktulosphaira vitifoliae]
MDYSDLNNTEKYADVEERIRYVKQINQLSDPTQPFSHKMVFNKQSLELKMNFLKATNIKNLEREEIFHLFKKNMMESYKNCPWGWQERKKRSEMFHCDARYIIVRYLANNELAAFIHFRFDLEDSIEVLYLYEIQLKPEVRSRGLGKYLMELIEIIAFHHNMKKVVLTVLKNEEKVVQFYMSQNYEIESYSPKNSFYYILSKRNHRLTNV